MTEPDELPDELPDEVRDPFRAATGPSPYAVPLTTLVGGAYVSLTEQVEVQPASAPDLGHHAGPVLGGGEED